MKEKLTIITPTYNRDKLLKRCYLSLKNQTKKNFVWLIIDDGSTDDTYDVINEFISESLLKIEYHKKDNGGKHTALNFSKQFIKTELIMILDSDDVLTKNAVEIITKDYEKYKENNIICGASYLKGDLNKNVIGKEYPDEEIVSNYINYRINKEINSDSAEVFKTNVFKKYSFPEIKNEKFLSEGYLWVEISKEYKTYYFNRILYLCEYQKGGLTDNWRLINLKSPMGASMVENKYLTKDFKLKIRIKHGILYNLYSLYAHKKISLIIKESNNRMNSIVLFLPSLIVYKIFKMKYKEV